MTLTTTIPGLVLVFEDVDLLALGLSEHLRGHRRLGQEITIGHRVALVVHHEKR